MPDIFQSSSGSLARANTVDFTRPVIGWTNSGPPNKGYWHAGDILISTNVLRAGVLWLCVSDGNPGTWVRVDVTATTTDPTWGASLLGRVYSFSSSDACGQDLGIAVLTERSPQLGWSNARPDAGYWKVGDIFICTNATYVGLYICIAEGSPGTWRKLSPKTQQSFLFGSDWVNTGWNQSATSVPGALGAPTNVIATGGYLTCDTAGHMVAAPGTAVDEMYVEADIPYNGASDNSGLCLRLTDTYSLMLSPQGAVGATSIRYYEYSGIWNVLFTSPAFVVTGNVFNLKSIVRGTAWRAWVNDVCLGEILLSTATPGRVGFRNVTANQAMFNRLAYSY